MSRIILLKSFLILPSRTHIISSCCVILSRPVILISPNPSSSYHLGLSSSYCPGPLPSYYPHPSSPYHPVMSSSCPVHPSRPSQPSSLSPKSEKSREELDRREEFMAVQARPSVILRKTHKITKKSSNIRPG